VNSSPSLLASRVSNPLVLAASPISGRTSTRASFIERLGDIHQHPRPEPNDWFGRCGHKAAISSFDHLTIVGRTTEWSSRLYIKLFGLKPEFESQNARAAVQDDLALRSFLSQAKNSLKCLRRFVSSTSKSMIVDANYQANSYGACGSLTPHKGSTLGRRC